MGGYEEFQEQPALRESSIDRICFTDRPDLVTEPGWQIRQIPLRIPGDPARSSRWPKIRPNLFLADYDCSLYFDNSVRFLSDPAEIIPTLLPVDHDFAVLRHSYRSSVSDEFAAVEEGGLDSPWRLREQRRTYEAVDPASLTTAPLWGGLLLRRHNSPKVISAMSIWWEQVLRFSRRDQLSMPFALRQAGLEPLVHDIDNRESAFHSWPHAVGRRPAKERVPIEPDATIAALERANRLAGAETAGLADRVGTLIADLAAERDETERTARRLDQILRSRSWRLTAPLRSIRRRL